MSGAPRSLLVLTTAHPPNDKRVHHKFVRSFLEAGWTVSWLGPEPRCEWDGAADERVDYTWTRTLRGRTGRVLSARRLARAAAQLESCPAWIYCPDPDAVPVALRLRERTGARVVFDIHEAFHQTHVGRWLGPLNVAPLREVFRRRIAHLASRADLVSGVSQGVLDAYTGGRDDALMLRNTPPRWFALEQPAPPWPAGADFRLMHGLIGPARGTRELAAALGGHDGGGGRLVVVGFGDEATLAASVPSEILAACAPASPGFHLERRDPIPYQEMPQVLQTCHAGVISYTGAMMGPNLANRLFEFMAHGLPVIAPDQSPEIARVLAEVGAGVLYRMGDAASLRRAVLEIRDDPERAAAMGAAGRAAFLREYSWESQFATLLARMTD